MQIKLDKLGITVEFVAGQIYELEFDIPSDSMLFGVEMNGLWEFDGENFKPQFTTDAITINSRAIKELCIAIEMFNKDNCQDLVEFCASHGSNYKTQALMRLGCWLTIVGHNKPTVDNTDEQEINKLADEMYETFKKAAERGEHGWPELARKMYYPKKALDEALASEREYFGLLRQIGQHLGVNVGTDVGVTELPGYVETLKDDLNKTGRACVERREKLIKALGYLDHHLSFSGLCDQVKELRDENHKLKNDKPVVPAGVTTLHLSRALTQSMMCCLEREYKTNLDGSVSSLDAYYMIEDIVEENVKLKENLKILNEAIETKSKVDNAVDVVKRYEKGELTPEQARDLLSK